MARDAASLTKMARSLISGQFADQRTLIVLGVSGEGYGPRWRAGGLLSQGCNHTRLRSHLEASRLFLKHGVDVTIRT